MNYGKWIYTGKHIAIKMGGDYLLDWEFRNRKWLIACCGRARGLYYYQRQSGLKIFGILFSWYRYGSYKKYGGCQTTWYFNPRRYRREKLKAAKTYLAEGMYDIVEQLLRERKQYSWIRGTR